MRGPRALTTRRTTSISPESYGLRLNGPVPLLMLIAPSLNRVYAGEAPRLAAAELAVTAGVEVEPVVIAGVDYLRIDAEADQRLLATVAVQSAKRGLY